MRFEQRTPTSLTIIGTTQAEVLAIVNHFNLGVIGSLPELTKGYFEYTSDPKERFWYPVCTTLSPVWIQPYYDLLNKVTGYEGPFFDMEAVPHNNYNWLLQHTHIVQDSWIEGGGYVNEGFIQSWDWNGQSAEVRAQINFDEYVRSFVGWVKPEPEFIKGPMGGEMRNPRYLKINPAIPKLNSQALWTAIYKHWVEHVATPGQKELVRKGIECDSIFHTRPIVSPYQDGFHIDSHTNMVTYEQFKSA